MNAINYWEAGGILLGGIGLFLLGMSLMTDGLRLAAGPALERILAGSTATSWRGVTTGIVMTALVQSSTVITVTTIGFVNAGLFTLGQALWVIFGSNVGSVMTGWLVALVGMKFKIDAIALPLIGLGMGLRLLRSGKRSGALGTALAGFGLLFLGIDMLQQAFADASQGLSVPQLEGAIGVLALVLIGILMTLVLQASAATLVLAFNAAQSGMVTLDAAAAIIIGANVGTTATAILAAIGATAAAKRAAAAHVAFNVIAAIVALALLPWLLKLIVLIREALEMDAAPAATLALFHTSFNVIGLIVIWPLAARLTRFLESRFRSAEEDEAKPRYLDANVTTVPTLALDALEREVRRIGGIALRMVADAATRPLAARPFLVRDQAIVNRLNLAVAEFIARVQRGGMTPENAARLPRLLRLARYYESAAELAEEAAAAIEEVGVTLPAPLPGAEAFVARAEALLPLADPGQAVDASRLDAAVADMEEAYHAFKAELLEAGAQGHLPVGMMDARLRAASALRRALEQVAKAARGLGPDPSAPPPADAAADRAA